MAGARRSQNQDPHVRLAVLYLARPYLLHPPPISTLPVRPPACPAIREEEIFYLPCGDMCSTTCLDQNEEQPSIQVSQPLLSTSNSLYLVRV